MKKTLFIFSTFILLFFSYSCSLKEQQNETENPVFGLATPIVLGVDSTIVIIEDYIDIPIDIDSVQTDEHLSSKLFQENKKILLVNKDGLPKVSLLRVFYPQGSVDIPVYKSKKIKVHFSYDPKGKSYSSVNLVGDINAWNPANTPLVFNENKWETDLFLIPGDYGYQIVLDGVWTLDEANDTRMSNGMGGFNSKLIVAGVDPSKTPGLAGKSFSGKRIEIEAINQDGFIALWNNQKIEVQAGKNDYSLTIPEGAKKVKRSYLRIWAYNELAASSYLKIPLHFGEVLNDPKLLDRMDKETNIMYFMMVDRFNNGSPENDKKIEDPAILPKANYFGGDLQGITAKIEDGYFDKLGINNIWLSPIVRNPEEAYGLYNKNGIKSKFSAYHGYWPTSFTKVNPHFGDESALHDLINLAHQKEYNVLLDFVANHVHESHPVYQANKNNGWATNLYLPDGSLNTEKWDEHRLTTWFDVFLPTLNLEKQEIAEMLSDSAMFWVEEYGFDGFRHDATKHIPESFWRLLTKKVKAYERKTGKAILQLGETYGTSDLINSYIGSGMLDGQFDFNVFDALLAGICQDETGFEAAKKRILQSRSYYGANHVMGNISGNQDRTRFMALATGDVRFDEDSKYAGWSRDIHLKNKKGYQRLAILHALNMTIPGIPVIYYGDEIGLTGGNDPDNRRMMYFDKLNEDEQKLMGEIELCTKLRRGKMSLLFGDFEFLHADDDHMAFVRRYFGETTIVLVNNSLENKKLKLKIPSVYNIEHLKSNNGHHFKILEGGILEIEMRPLSFEIIGN